MSANDQQVPNYYLCAYMHWDICLAIPLCYFAGNSTKYVTRWRKKNGIADLRKALTYLNKLEDTVTSGPTRKLFYKEIVREVNAFSDANKLSDLEREYIWALCTWSRKEDLIAAREILFLLMDEAEAKMLADGAKPVPLCEENHYSERYSGA